MNFWYEVLVAGTFTTEKQKQVLYGPFEKHLGGVFGTLAQSRKAAEKRAHVIRAHVHMLTVIPPKYVGFANYGKSILGEKHDASGAGLWREKIHCAELSGARMLVSPVGLDAQMIQRLRPIPESTSA